MTVEQLIEELQNFDKEALVFYVDSQFGYMTPAVLYDDISGNIHL